MFLLNVFFLFQYPIQGPYYMRLSVCLGSSWRDNFWLSLFLSTFTVWKSWWYQYFVEYPSTDICLMFFSWLDEGYGFSGGRSKKYHSHHILSRVHQQDLPPLIGSWLPGWGRFVKFLHSEVTTTTPKFLPAPATPIFSYRALWKEVTTCSSHSRSEHYVPLLKGKVST